MSAENLWGEIPKTGTLRTPIAILREQAGLLGEATNNLLIGDVSVVKHGAVFKETLMIIAPALDNYMFALLQVDHSMTLYPLTVTDIVNGGQVRCKDEGEFLVKLKTILSSGAVHRIIESLLSQSQAA